MNLDVCTPLDALFQDYESNFQGLLQDAHDMLAGVREFGCRRNAERTVTRCVHGFVRNRHALDMVRDWNRLNLITDDHAVRLEALVGNVDEVERRAMAAARDAMETLPDLPLPGSLTVRDDIPELLLILSISGDEIEEDLRDLQERKMHNTDSPTDLELDEREWWCCDERTQYQKDLGLVREWRKEQPGPDLECAEHALVRYLDDIAGLQAMIASCRECSVDRRIDEERVRIATHKGLH
jgi:hypothetical protein